MKKKKPQLTVENPFGKPLPATETLALLAAQGRFRSLPSKAAVSGALELWKEAQDVLARESSLAEKFQQHYVEPVAETHCPPSYPAPFPVFLRLVVQGKDEGESLTRFRQFLAHGIRMEEVRRMAREDVRAEVTRAGRKATEDEIKALAADKEFEFLDSVAVVETTDPRVIQRLEAYREKQFSESVWQGHASRFMHWWIPNKLAAKKRAGTMGHAAKERKRAKAAAEAAEK